MQFDRVGPFERDRVFAVMSLSFGNATVSIVVNEPDEDECNLTEWCHLNVIFFLPQANDTDEDRVQFDRVGPFERDWVWLRCHSLLEMPPFPS